MELSVEAQHRQDRLIADRQRLAALQASSTVFSFETIDELADR